MSWKFVFNTVQADDAIGEISDAKYPDYFAKIAISCGYKFFTWRDEVFYITGDYLKATYHKTNIKVSDLV